ncbi:MAG: rane protein of unknown function [Candidatus Saccharibacteria bacterium]|nr:rane protein of unknown function [Candidatus Saccharibacteria bacterium]
MNEVTRIHLGRQSFTISVEAHRALKAYLVEIQKQVADDDVANEVELRMSELLGERGVSGEKVILPEDVDFLKQQLGNPTDFSDEESSKASKTDEPAERRLFRDTDAAMLAGVSAGVANYFGLDTVLVRLIFVLLTIFGGGLGIVLYVVLWLVVPPATTASEKLQMQGKSVTLGALKDSVNKAGLSDAARRANGSFLSIINSILGAAIKIIGVGFIVAGTLMILALVALKTYMLLHHGQLFEENLFPVDFREQWLMTLGMILTAIVAVFLVLFGVANLKRKWPVRGWVTAVLVGVFLVGLTASMALSADIAPRVRERYEESLHTTAIKNIQPFDKVTTTGGIDIAYVTSPTYSVNLHYSGQPDLSKIKVDVQGKTLHIDSTTFDGSKHCDMLCLFPEYNMTVEIFAPNVQDFNTSGKAEVFFPHRPEIN